MKTLSDRFPWWWGNGYRILSWKWWCEWRYFVKMWWGWAFRGDAGEWWSLSTCWVAYVLPKLYRLRDERTGMYPGGLIAQMYPGISWGEETDDQCEAAYARWTEILTQVITGFEVLLEDDWILCDLDLDEMYGSSDLEPPLGYQTWREAQDVAKTGMDLWHKWWPAMWD